MSGRRHDERPLVAFVKTALIDQLDLAVRNLSAVDRHSGIAVHEARKSIKRARATLGLLAAADPKSMRLEDAALADAARLLGPIRDKDVARQLKATALGTSRRVAPPPMSPLVRAWVTQSMTILIGVRLRLDRCDVGSLDAEDILRAANESHRSARRRWKKSSRSLEPEALHRCRKAAKQSQYQLELLLTNVSRNDPRLVALAEFGELLGDHHDLVVAEAACSPTDLEALEASIVSSGRDLFTMTTGEHRRWLDGLLTAR